MVVGPQNVLPSKLCVFLCIVHGSVLDNVLIANHHSMGCVIVAISK